MPAKPAPAKETAAPAQAAPKVERAGTARRSKPTPAASEKPDRKAAQRTREGGSTLAKQGKREIMIAFASAVVVLIIAAVVLWKVLGQKRAEAAETRARLEKVERFRSDFTAIDISTEEGAQRLLAFAEEQKTVWAEADFASDVVNRTAKAKTFLQGFEERRTLTRRLEEVEGVLARASELSLGELAEQRRRLDELTSKAEVLGAEFTTRLAQDRATAELAYVDGHVAAASAAAAAEPLDRVALATIQQAEDEILKIFEESYRAWQKDTQDAEATARKVDREQRYKALIELSDTAVQRFFTPQVIESTPWRDLLSAEQARNWRGATLRGFEYRIENGVMHLIGPDPEEQGEGIISIGDKEAWRDFVLDAEFTVTSGECTLFFRLPPVWQENVENHYLTTGEGDLVAGESYTYSFSLIGSAFTHQEHGEGSLGPTVRSINWTRVRKGALGISIPKDSEVRFTRLRVKILR